MVENHPEAFVTIFRNSSSNLQSHNTLNLFVFIFLQVMSLAREVKSVPSCLILLLQIWPQSLPTQTLPVSSPAGLLSGAHSRPHPELCTFP